MSALGAKFKTRFLVIFKTIIKLALRRDLLVALLAVLILHSKKLGQRHLSLTLFRFVLEFNRVLGIIFSLLLVLFKGFQSFALYFLLVYLFKVPYKCFEALITEVFVIAHVVTAVSVVYKTVD